MTDPEKDAAAFEAEVERIESEIRALFAAHAEQAGSVPERLARLARELERLQAERTARRPRPDGFRPSSGRAES